MQPFWVDRTVILPRLQKLSLCKKKLNACGPTFLAARFFAASARCCSCLNLHSVIDERIESSVSFCFFSCFTAALSAWDCACRFCFCLQLSASRLLFCSCLLRLKKSNGKARKDEDCKNHTLEPFPSWRPAGTWPV